MGDTGGGSRLLSPADTVTADTEHRDEERQYERTTPLDSSSIVLMAYPNSGEEWNAETRDWVEGTGLRGRDEDLEGGVKAFGRMARDEWYVSGTGARIIGGCCRTRPAHIAEIRRILSAAEGSSSVEKERLVI